MKNRARSRSGRTIGATLGAGMLAALAAVSTFTTHPAAADTERLAQSPNALRGQRLYENACIACHGESVHDRKQRTAQSFEGIREYVRRWSRVVATQWTDEDVEDVTVYLNERYYRFTCPAGSCRPERAHGPDILSRAPSQ